ncbi:MAG: hypothetical protein U1G05_13125 [Kiritimatiellia bacterium]
MTVNGSGVVVDGGGGNPPIVPPNGWFAFTWHTPSLPLVWQAAAFREEHPALEILQNGAPAPMMDHWRVDGRDGDAGFNPYGVPAGDTATRAYRVRIPRVTAGTNLTFIARADGSAANILLKLDGGMDLNSHLGLGPQAGDLRDVPPGLNNDLLEPDDTVKQSATDTYLGYEQSSSGASERFAARDVARNVIGSPGAETYQATIGAAGFTVNNGGGPNTGGDRHVNWAFHDPAGVNQEAAPVPADESAPWRAPPAGRWTCGSRSATASRPTASACTTPPTEPAIPRAATASARAPPRWPAARGTPTARPTAPTPPTGEGRRCPPCRPAPSCATRSACAAAAAAEVFPFSSDNIDLAERMETRFAITGFNAAAALHFVHNDYGRMAAGLDEGFHVLRSRAFVKAPTARRFTTPAPRSFTTMRLPAGVVRYPAENDTLGGSYGAVVRTDASVTEVWYYVDDLDPANDNPATGNGLNNWKRATQIAQSRRRRRLPALEWALRVRRHPGRRPANLVVRLREASSSSDLPFSDEAAWTTTLVRHVNTGSSINFNIGIPTTPGEVVDRNYVMRTLLQEGADPPGHVRRRFPLRSLHLHQQPVSGQPDNPVLQARAQYRLDRDVNGAEHSIAFTFPNLYNGEPDFLHTVRIEHRRGSLTLGDSEQVRMAVDETSDGDGDGLPDFWERIHRLDPQNGTGRNGPDGDDDEDGFGNLQEFMAGMNPLEADLEKYPALTLTPNPGWPGEMRLQFLHSQPALPHALFRRPRSLARLDRRHGHLRPARQPLNTWIDNGNSTHPHPAQVPRRYYRLGMMP